MNSSILSWQQQLKHSFTKPEQLLKFLNIDPSVCSHSAHQNFSLRVPLAYAQSMEKENINDPLLKQVLPIYNEINKSSQDYQLDPVGDLDALIHNTIIHKYKNRILLIISGGCAINCRFCFRRNFPYTDVQLNTQKEQIVLQYLHENPDIDEIILSGGDPLLLNDHRLQHLINIFSQLKQLKRIRIHTRLPIVLPDRITSTLLEIFTNAALPIIIVTHCNHPNELSPSVKKACLLLKQKNISLLNQSVLLKDINNNSTVLKKLSEQLFESGILPYYLHVLDHAKGTEHFKISDIEAIKLHQTLQQLTSGYLVPKLVRENAGHNSKTLLI